MSHPAISCPRCAHLSPEALAWAESFVGQPVQVGRVTLAEDEAILPVELGSALTVTESKMMVRLLRGYPRVVPYLVLDVGNWQASDDGRWHTVRVVVSRMGPKLWRYGLVIRSAPGRGYRLEVSDA